MKKIISLILAVLMIMSISATGVSAEVYYNLYIGEKAVTSTNASDVFGDGTVSFDKDTNTLTLNNADIQGLSMDGTGTGIKAENIDLTIELKGRNTITVENPESITNYGVLITGGSLTIKSNSDGKLIINAEDATETVYGIYSDALINVSGANLDITTGDADTSIGIKTEATYVYNDDNSKVVSVNRSPLSFTDGAKVTITTGKSVTASQGINCFGDLSVDKAVLNVASGTCENTSDAIIVKGYTKFISGKVTAFAQGGGTDASAISCNRDDTLGEVRSYGGGAINIYFDAEVVAKTGEVIKNSAGINCGSLTVHGGKLDITVGNAVGNEELCCYGISTNFGITINGGTTTISVPESTNETHDFTPIKLKYGKVSLSDNITVTGTKTPFKNGDRNCVQADPGVPVVFTDNIPLQSPIENDYKDGQLIVAGIAVTSNNAVDAFGDGTVSFDTDTCTLTLNDAKIKISTSADTSTGIKAENINLTIILNGNNTITVENPDNTANYGIFVSEGALTLKSTSEGTLTINSGTATESSFGIYSVGPMSVLGADIDITTGDADNSIGIKTESYCVNDTDSYRGKLSFTDDAKVKITTGAGTTLSSGINCVGGFVIDKAEINTTSAINILGDAKFISGKISVNKENGDNAISCIRTEEKISTADEVIKYGGNLDIYDGMEIIAKTGDAEFGGFGINASHGVTIHGGNITIKTGNIIGGKIRRSYGIFSVDGSIIIFGGTVSISVPERVEQYDDFMSVSTWHGSVRISDNITVTGTMSPFFNGGGGCGQADPDVPVVFTDNAQNKNLLGDVNLDGSLNIKDATSIQKFIAGLEEFIAEIKSLADYNADGDVNIKDATAIQKKIAGLI